jgi:hypothetical protein
MVAARDELACAWPLKRFASAARVVSGWRTATTEARRSRSSFDYPIGGGFMKPAFSKAVIMNCSRQTGAASLTQVSRLRLSIQ